MSNPQTNAKTQPDEVAPVPVHFEAELQPPKKEATQPVIKEVRVSQPTSNTTYFSTLGTHKYDGQKPAAREIIKVPFSFQTEDLPEGEQDPFVVLLNSDTYKTTADVAVGDDFLPFSQTADDSHQNFVDNLGNHWRCLDDKQIALADGSYVRKVIAILPEPQEEEVTYTFSVVNGRIKDCLWTGPFYAQEAYADGDPVPLGFDSVESNYLQLPYVQDLYTMLSNTDFSFNFQQYEAYSIKFLQLNLIDCENWLTAGGSLLTYYISDPVQTHVYNLATFSDKAVAHYPHLHTVKIFRHGTSFSAKIPVPANVFFTKPEGLTRLYSPGILGIIPLPGVPVNKFKIAAMLDSVIDFYAPTAITSDPDTRAWVSLKLPEIGDVSLYQELPEANIYFEVPTNFTDGKYQPTAPVNFKINFKGYNYYDYASKLIVAEQQLRVYLAHLHEHTADFADSQATIEIVDAPDTFIRWT